MQRCMSCALCRALPMTRLVQCWWLSRMADIRMHVTFTDIKDQEKFLRLVNDLVKTIKVVILLISIEYVYYLEKCWLHFLGSVQGAWRKLFRHHWDLGVWGGLWQGHHLWSCHRFPAGDGGLCHCGGQKVCCSLRPLMSWSLPEKQLELVCFGIFSIYDPQGK